MVLEGRLRQALARLNKELPADALEDAFRKLTRTDAPSLLERNRAVHRMLVEGVTVEYRGADGSIAGAQARVIIAATIEAGLIMPDESVGGSRKFARYLPFWA